MPEQPPILSVPVNTKAAVPGATNLTEAELTGDMIVSLATAGSGAAQSTLNDIAGYIETQITPPPPPSPYPAAFPNNFVATDPSPPNTAGQGKVPSLRLMSPRDLPQLMRDGTKQFNRWLTEVALDHGRSFEWYRNRKTPYDDTASFHAALTEEDVLVIDRPTIFLSGSIGPNQGVGSAPGGELTGKTIISLLGQEPVTIIQQSTTARIFDFTGCERVRLIGLFRLVYSTPAALTNRAVYLNTCNDIYADDFIVENCAVGMYGAACSNVRFGSFTVRNPVDDAVVLTSGSGISIDDHMTLENGAARGFVTLSGWGGGFKCNRMGIKGFQQVGVDYASAGVLDQITDLRVSNNGLSASGTLAGVKIEAAARDLRVLGGEIGQDAAGSGATQSFGVTIAAGAQKIAIGANLLGNVAAYSNSSTDPDISLSGIMPTGTLPLYSTNQKAALGVGGAPGTYTPTIGFSAANDAVFAGTIKGWYTKVGQTVYVNGIVSGTLTWTTATGNLQIGLPFQAFTDSGPPQPGLQITQPNNGISWGTGTQLGAFVLNNQSLFELSTSHSGGASGLITTASLTSGGNVVFTFSGSYLASS